MKNLIFFVVAAGFVASLLEPASAQSFLLEPLWNLDPGSRSYLPAAPGDNNQRGIAYNPATGNVLLVNRTTSLSVNIVNGLTGADVGALNVAGITGGTFALNQIGAAADGAIYAANLKASAGDGNSKIYRWANENAVPTVAFDGQLGASGTRWGDNMDIRGSGNSTQILFGQGGSSIGNQITVFNTSDGGLTLAPTTVTLSGITAGDTRGGIAFNAGNTFFVKTAAGTILRYANFDLGAGTANVTASPTMPSGLVGFGPLGSDPVAHLLAGVQVDTTSGTTAQQKLYLFDITDPANPATLDIEGFVNPGNRNSNASGAVDFGDGKVYAIDTNNGLRAFTVAVPEPSASAAAFGFVALGAAMVWRRSRPHSTNKTR